MERRLLLVFVLTFAVLLISQPLLMKYIKPQQPATEQKPAATQPAAGPCARSCRPPRRLPKPSRPRPAAARQAAAEQETVIENDLYRIVFTNRGAQVKSWVLKKYHDEHGQPARARPPGRRAAVRLSALALDLRRRPAQEARLRALRQQRRRGRCTRPPTSASSTPTPTSPSARRFHFDHSYVVKIETSVTQNGQPVRAFPAWPAGFGDQATPASYAAATVDLYAGETNWHGGEKVMRERHQENQQRRHHQRSIRLGRCRRPVLRRRLPARRSQDRGAGHAAQRDRSSQGPRQARRRQDQGRGGRRRRRQHAAAPPPSASSPDRRTWTCCSR